MRDEADQARYVAERILEHREAQIPLKQQAVLFRTSHHSGPLEIELTRHNIPFVKFGGLKFLEAAHIKDVLGLLRWAENLRDQPRMAPSLEIAVAHYPMHPQVADFIQGHGKGSVSAKHGAKWPKTLKKTVEMIPRYRIAGLPTRPTAAPSQTRRAAKPVADTAHLAGTERCKLMRACYATTPQVRGSR